MTEKLKIAVIGPGRVGMTLAILAVRTGLYEVIVGARDLKKARKEAINGAGLVFLTVSEAVKLADFVLFTVSDDVIAPLCRELAAGAAFRPSTIVAHCSGALTSDELLPAKRLCDAHLASMHPLQTFPDVPSSLERVLGTYCYYEAEPEAKAVIDKFAQDIGMNTIEINKEAKTLYHVSAVVACNYLTALMDSSLELAELAGIDRDTMWRSLEPLIASSLDNIKRVGPEGALTGPIVRADIETLTRHIETISNVPKGAGRLKNIYAALGRQTAKLARKKRAISKATEAQINQVFKAN